MHLLDDLGWTIKDARETFYVTLPAAEFRSWLEISLEMLEEAWSRTAHCFAVAGHIVPPEYPLATRGGGRASRLAWAGRRDLDLWAVCVAVLDRLTEGGRCVIATAVAALRSTLGRGPAVGERPERTAWLTEMNVYR